jgi:hypothetical protein
MSIFEVTIDEVKGGYKPHIRLKKDIVKDEFGNYWKLGKGSNLAAAFPTEVGKLRDNYIDSDGRELYAKGLGIPRITSNYEQALRIKAFYETLVK